MSTLDASSAVADPLPQQHTDVGVFSSVAEGEEHGLVVLAAGHAYWLLPSDTGFRLIVETAAVAQVRRHLSAYARERLAWPPRPPTDLGALHGVSLVTPLAWGAVILALHQHAGAWRSAAAMDAVAVFDRNEWWRPFTALFFHASAEHVLSNLLSGLFVLTATVATLGRLRAWLLTLVAAVVGNLVLGALHYPESYRSLGASTALFAALGVLTGRAARVVAGAPVPRRGLRPFFLPLATGLVVFALHNGSGPHVDVGAHLGGFTAGLIAGFCFGLGRINRTAHT